MSIDATWLHAMQLTYTFDSYDRCRQWKLPSMPSHEGKLYDPDNSDNDLRRDIRATGMMVVGAWVRQSRYAHGITFGCSLVSLFSSSVLWITARYKWRRHGFLPPANAGGVSPCTGSAERSPLSCTDRLWDLWVRMIAYIGWLFHLCFPFLSFSLVQFMQPRRSAPEERENVTAARDPGPGNGHSI